MTGPVYKAPPSVIELFPTILPGPTSPDWPPRDSAWRFDEGTLKYGSTGQLFEVRHRRWVRVPGAQQQ